MAYKEPIELSEESVEKIAARVAEILQSQNIMLPNSSITYAIKADGHIPPKEGVNG